MRPGQSAGLMMFGFATLLGGCEPQCSSDLISSTTAANGLVARLEKKNCGATTGYVYEVKTVEPQGRAQTVLRFDSDHNLNWPNDDTQLLRMRWIDGAQLALNLSVPVRVFKAEDEVNGVRVRYRYMPGTKLL